MGTVAALAVAGLEAQGAAGGADLEAVETEAQEAAAWAEWEAAAAA